MRPTTATPHHRTANENETSIGGAKTVIEEIEFHDSDADADADGDGEG